MIWNPVKQNQVAILSSEWLVKMPETTATLAQFNAGENSVQQAIEHHRNF